MERARRTGADRAAAVLWIATVVLAVASVIGLLLARDDVTTEDAAITAGGVLAGALYASIGAVIVRRARNVIGWILEGVGTAFVLLGVATVYALIGVATSPGSLPSPIEVQAAADWIFGPAISAVAFMLFVYPTGSLPSPRWRPVVWLGIAVATVTGLGTLINPARRISLANGDYTANPFGVEGLGDLIGGVLVGSVWVLSFTIGAAILALVLRFRRGRAEERQQIKWLAFVAAIAGLSVLTALGSLVACGCDDSAVAAVAFMVFFAVVLLGVPGAIAVAILKHGLYEIDVIINRTVAYGVLAAVLTAVYVAIVVGIGAAIGQRGNSALTIFAASAVALAFQPLRSRAQRLANRLVYGERATPYQVLSEFAERMAGTYDVDDVLERMAAILAAGAGATRVDVWLRVGSELRIAATWPGEKETLNAVPLSDDGALPRFDGVTRAVAVRHGEDLLGALTVIKPPNEPLSPTEEKLLEDLASQAGLVLRNARLTAELQANVEELRASRRRLVEAQDQERRKIERNLHDGAQQQLVALTVQLGLLERVADDPERVRTMTAALQGALRGALDELRDLARGIYPPLLADKGLAEALASQARKAAVPTSIEPDGVGRYPQEVEAAVYFCALEALQNVAKYAEASRAVIRLAERDGWLTFEVDDDGRGFDPSVTRYGTGLQGMADRLDALGGTIETESAPGSGTVVRGRLRVR